MPSDKFVTANGLRLHYLDHGNEGAPWLVCIHGLTGNAHNFDALAPVLTPRYHVISIDVRGRGDSEWGPPTEYLHQNYASDLAAMLETLGVARTSLIGTSMGGIISMMYAGGWPNRVERLLLNDIGPEINEAGAARIGNYVGNAPERFKDLDEVVAHFKQNYPAMARLTNEVAREFVKWSVKPAPDSGLMWKMDPNVRRPVRGTRQRFDFWVPYARITCPILIVRGGESDILAPDTTARMCKVQNLATVVEIPGVAHAPMLTEPASLAAIKEFFKLQ
jgi:pimeloyl-ACP methyl ester carboxylesterase